jgi:hypothetical protein
MESPSNKKATIRIGSLPNLNQKETIKIQLAAQSQPPVTAVQPPVTAVQPPDSAVQPSGGPSHSSTTCMMASIVEIHPDSPGNLTPGRGVPTDVMETPISPIISGEKSGRDKRESKAEVGDGKSIDLILAGLSLAFTVTYLVVLLSW